jgi:hypothetical protein
METTSTFEVMCRQKSRSYSTPRVNFFRHKLGNGQPTLDEKSDSDFEGCHIFRRNIYWAEIEMEGKEANECIAKMA